MENKKIPDEFFTTDSFKTLGGSSTAVWLVTNVIASVFSYQAKWIGLVVALIIAISACIGKKKLEVKFYAIALLNGLLIYSTSVGIDSIKKGAMDVDTAKVSQHTDIPRSGLNEASFNLFGGPAWWEPQYLVEKIELITYENKTLLNVRDSLITENKKLTEDKNNVQGNLEIYNSKIDSLTKELQDSTEKNVYENEADRNNKLEAENKSLKNKIAALQKESYNPTNGDNGTEIKKLNDKISFLQSETKRLQNLLNQCIKDTGWGER